MKYYTGALKSKKDNRNIPLSKLVKSTKLPDSFVTDISMIPVLDQKKLGACVGHAFASYLAYLNYKETGKVEYLSPRFIYALAKKIDGLATEGTYPTIAVHEIFNKGCLLDEDCKNDTSLTHAEYINITLTEAGKKKALKYKIGGYAFPTITENGLKEALVHCGVITIAMNCGTITSKTIRAGRTNGSHYVMLYGYKTAKGDTTFYYRNSWGEKWGNKGNGSFSWKEFTAKNIFDAISIVDIPNTIIEEARAGWKYFKPTEKTGNFGTVADLKTVLVDMLDKTRDMAGIPFKITSGFRTPEHNKKIGGAVNSAHLRGYAVDIACTNEKNRWLIVNAAIACGFTRIGIGKNFVHLDCDPSLTPNVIWLY